MGLGRVAVHSRMFVRPFSLSCSGFGDAQGHTLERTELEDELRARGIDEVFVGGLALDYCVAYTCKDAAKAGFRTHCILEGSRGIAQESIEQEVKLMQELGVKVLQSREELMAAVGAADSHGVSHPPAAASADAVTVAASVARAEGTAMESH